MKHLILLFLFFCSVSCSSNAQEQPVPTSSADTIPAQKITLLFAGDLMQHQAQIDAAIVEKEKAASELKRKYFGPEGELFKKREELMKPIQDEIYNAVKAVAEENGYAVVVDRASASSIIFATPRIDVSNEVLAKLGYSN